MCKPEVSVDLYALAKMCFILMTGVTVYLVKIVHSVMTAVDMLNVITGFRRIPVTGCTSDTAHPASPGVVVAESTILLLRMLICRAIDLMT
jgi:hypothetical protein